MHIEQSCFCKRVKFWYQTNACPTAHKFDLIWASQLRFRVVIITIGTLGFDHRKKMFSKKVLFCCQNVLWKFTYPFLYFCALMIEI